jgi:hypothetical protein
MFLESGKAQATGQIAVTREFSPLLLRAAHLLGRLVQRIAAFAQGRIIDRRLRTSRWCDSTERALLEDLTGLRRDSFTGAWPEILHCRDQERRECR